MIAMVKNAQGWRQDFPMFAPSAAGKLAYLDSGATAQKPQCVIDAVERYYTHDNANIHRGVYELSERATRLFENVREQVKQFIHAKYTTEIIFTHGTTDAINLVAHSFGRLHFKPGDEILVSEMEHHSNIVPWQLVSELFGTRVKKIPVTDTGEIDLTAYQALINARTKMIAITHVSNVLGTVNPLKKMIHIAHQHQVPVLVDGAQAIAHLPVDVEDLDCDFYAFSSHKAYGPMGVGVLYGKQHWLEKMPPYQGGGDMIETVSFAKTTFNKVPHKFEAGTPDVGGVIGFGAALCYLSTVGMDAIMAHETALLAYTRQQLQTIPALRIIGSAPQQVAAISWVIDDIHPHDIGTILSHEGIAVRAGHHCAMPLMERFQVPATVRVSFGIYNTVDDIDRLMNGLHTVMRLFK